jgi:hypothetical protein
MENKTLLIDRNAFCDWYFDYDTCKDFFNDRKILYQLKTNGSFSITLQNILNGMDYVPTSVIADSQRNIYDDLEEVFLSGYDTIKFDN